MVVQAIAEAVLTCLSTDAKPTAVNLNTLCIETDTGKSYYWNGSTWVLQSSGSSEPKAQGTATVAHNTTSVVVTILAQANNTYQVSHTPAYNTTVWVTSKTTTGFTLNFGTGGPVGGSTCDWCVF